MVASQETAEQVNNVPGSQMNELACRDEEARKWGVNIPLQCEQELQFNRRMRTRILEEMDWMAIVQRQYTQNWMRFDR